MLTKIRRKRPSRLSDLDRRRRLFRPLSVESLESRRVLAAAIFTDKLDYAPGETAAISGSGFVTGETVALQVLHTDGTPNTGEGHDPWTVTDGGAGDLDSVADGNIQTTWYVDPDDSIGANFVLTATGMTSGESAMAYFTVADNVGPLASQLSITPNITKVTPTITATIDDGQGRGNSNIVAAEFFVDSTGSSGTGRAMVASDGAFNNKKEDVTAVIPSAVFNSLSDGTHTIFVHGRDAAGNWDGFVSGTFVKGNTPPVANGQSLTTAEDTANSITLSGTDSDGDSLTYLIVGGPSHGSLSGSGASRVYTPAQDYNGTDSFTFKVNDGTADSSIATVSLSITAVNDPPVIGSFNSSPKVLKTTTMSLSVPVTDVDSDSWSYSLSNSAPGWASIGRSSGLLALSPDIDATDASFNVIARDSDGASVSQLVSVTVYSAGVKGHDLVVYGTSGDNQLRVTTHSPTVVTIDGVQQTILMEDGSTGSSFDVLASGGYIIIDLGNGANSAVAEGPAPIIYFGGNGADTITGGSGNDIIAGGNGPDTLNSDGGNDIIIGGRGPDTITGGVGTNNLFGGLISLAALNGLGLPASIVNLVNSRSDVVGDDTGDQDTLNETGDDASWALTNSSLDAGETHDLLTSIEIANLIGGASANSFTVSNWTGAASINADGGQDSLTVNSAATADSFTMSSAQISGAGGTINYSGIDDVILDADGGTDSFAGNFQTFTGSLSLRSFETASFVATNLVGSLSVQSPGILSLLTVSGIVSASSTITATDASNVTIGNLAGSMTVGSLYTASFGTITGSLTVNSPNTGEDINIGSMEGTLNAVHLVNLTVTNLSGTATVGELEGANIETLAADGTLTVTAANTGEDISIGSMEGTLNAVHLVNLTVTNLSGTATIGELEGANIDTLASDGTLTVTAANTGEDISIGNLLGKLHALHLTDLSVALVAATGKIKGIGGQSVDIEGASIATLSGTIDAENVDGLEIGEFSAGASFTAESIVNAVLPGSSFVLTNSSLTIDGATLSTSAGGFENLQLQGRDNSASLSATFDADFVLTDSSLSVSALPNVIGISGFSSVTLIGGAANNVLDTTAFAGGSVALFGLGGDDTLLGGSGNDLLDGGAGNDRLEGMAGNDIYVEVPGGTDTLVDTSGIDLIDFSGANYGITLDHSKSASQVQTVDSAANRVILSGTFENVNGSQFKDSLSGNAVDNWIQGLGGDDHVDGASGNDVLLGGVGNDNLVGGDGRDLLIGGLGADRIVGSADDDILIGGLVSFDGDTTTESSVDLAALAAVFAEWTSASSYLQRVANITNEVTNDVAPSNSRSNGNSFLKMNTTVFDDGANALELDRVTGSGGSDLYFLGANDTITGSTTGEIIKR